MPEKNNRDSKKFTDWSCGSPRTVSKSQMQEWAKPTRSETSLSGSIIPKSGEGAAAMGVITTVPLGVAATALAVYGFELYGLVLFCFLPFAIGLNSSLIYGYHKERRFKKTMWVSQAALFAVLGVIFLLAMEGAICLIMAAPIAMVLTGLGASIGWAISKKYFGTKIRTATLVSLIISVPALMGFEDAAYGEPHWITVTTEVFVDAPQQEVWEHLVDPSALVESEDVFFRRGVAHPNYVELLGEGPGATLRGEFSTGSFELAIDEWDAPNRLAVSVVEHPPTMQEWSIYGEIDAPHLVDYFVCETGQIELTPTTAADRTLLRATTTCRQQLGPQWYWSLWSETIIDRLHHHFFEDLRRRVEAR